MQARAQWKPKKLTTAARWHRARMLRYWVVGTLRTKERFLTFGDGTTVLCKALAVTGTPLRRTD